MKATERRGFLCDVVRGEGRGLTVRPLLIRAFCAIGSAPFLSINGGGRGLGRTFWRPLVAALGRGRCHGDREWRPLAVAMETEMAPPGGVGTAAVGEGPEGGEGSKFSFFPPETHNFRFSTSRFWGQILHFWGSKVHF